MTLMRQVGELVALMCEVAAEFGFECNLDEGKTAALVRTAGKHSRNVRKQIFHTNQGWIHFQIFDRHEKVKVVHAYKHFGTWLRCDMSYAKELTCRRKQANNAYLPLSKGFFRSPFIGIETKRYAWKALVLSRFTYNMHTWAWLTGAVVDRAEHFLARTAVTMVPKDLLLQQEVVEVKPAWVLAAAGLPSLRAYLSKKRLLYLPKCLSLATVEHVLCLLGAADKPESWSSWLRCDFAWLCDHCKAGTHLPTAMNLPEWFERAQKSDWQMVVRQAFASATSWESERGRMECWESNVIMDMEKSGVNLPADLASKKPPQPSGMFECLQCNFTCGSKRGMAVHSRHAHQYRTEARYYARDGKCSACMMDFHERARVIKHLQSKEACLSKLRDLVPPLSKSRLTNLTRSRRRKSGLSERMAGAPPKPWFQLFPLMSRIGYQRLERQSMKP